MMTVWNRLWGGRLESLTVDVANHSARFVVVTVTGEVTDVVDVMCTGSTEIRIFDDSPAAWSYAEVTEASASRLVDGSNRVELTMWKDAAGVSIRCEQIFIDGELWKPLPDP